MSFINSLAGLALIAASGVGGWIYGSIQPAPAEITNLVSQRAAELRARADLEGVSWEHLRGLVSEEDLARLSTEATNLGIAAGDLIAVEHDDAGLAEHAENLALDLGPEHAITSAAFEAALPFCPGMTVQNGPPRAGTLVANYRPVVNVNGVALAVNPTQGACLSSGFGPRNGRTHKGLDFHSADGGPVLAAGDGVVIEKKYRDDYGNMLLIDHGQGVYTRYAHLSGFARDLNIGDNVSAGEVIGLMGNTASYAIPIHLHYEVLLGDYANPRGSFGLTPHSPFVDAS